MQLQEASVLAEKVRTALEPLCVKIEIAGSIRRSRPEVHDVDLVAIPKSLTEAGPLGGTVQICDSVVWKERFPKLLKKQGLIVDVSGQELIRCSYPSNGFQVDLYRARAETWGVILLVRTGSKDHNVKLCSLARSKGLKLSACEGVVTKEGFGETIASRTEEEMFSALGLRFIEPKDREVSS